MITISEEEPKEKNGTSNNEDITEVMTKFFDNNILKNL